MHWATSSICASARPETRYTSLCSLEIRRDHQPFRFSFKGSGLPVPENGCRKHSEIKASSFLCALVSIPRKAQYSSQPCGVKASFTATSWIQRFHRLWVNLNQIASICIRNRVRQPFCIDRRREQIQRFMQGVPIVQINHDDRFSPLTRDGDRRMIVYGSVHDRLQIGAGF